MNKRAAPQFPNDSLKIRIFKCCLLTDNTFVKHKILSLEKVLPPLSFWDIFHVDLYTMKVYRVAALKIV